MPLITASNSVPTFLRDLAVLCPDVLVVSGLAYGIDIHAHRAALANHLPTVAVLAHGLDRIYPYVHRKTAIDMLGKGGLLTEFLTGTNPDKHNFVSRNRIVAGMSDATIVVESAAKGGSLITAELAEGYHRDCFAVPGTCYGRIFHRLQPVDTRQQGRPYPECGRVCADYGLGRSGAACPDRRYPA